jgi:glutathione peroxidase-family protein
VELGVEYTCEYGYISDSFYSSTLKMFDRVALECDQDEDLYKVLARRIEAVLSLSEDTIWGFEEALVEIYYSINWVHEEEEDE